jgi:hypothetical protein
MAFLILPELVTQFGGSKGELAKAVGIRPSALSRFVHTPPNVETCLRLARVTGANPSRILRAAGRGDVADLLESLYGIAAIRRMKHRRRDAAKQQWRIDRLEEMDAATLRAFDVLMDFATRTPQATAKRSTRRMRKVA